MGLLMLALMFIGGRLGIRPLNKEIMGHGINILSSLFFFVLWGAMILLLYFLLALGSRILDYPPGRSMKIRGNQGGCVLCLLLGMVTVGFAYPTTHYVNNNFGSDEILLTTGKVVDKDSPPVGGSIRDRYRLFIEINWRGETYEDQIFVHYDEYAKTKIGDRINVEYARGLLGLDYYLSISRTDGLTYRNSEKGMLF